MISRVLLVRHGPSSHVHDGRWMYHHRVREFEDAYDAASILHDSTPPDDLRRAAARADLLCSSDLPRAIASVERVAPGRAVAISPLLREIRLEPPRWIPVRLPIAVWDYFSHAQWSYRLRTRCDHEFVRRADDAIDWLEHNSPHASTVLVLTHAGFRRILAGRLIARGWRHAREKQSYAHWSTWELQHN
jgi:broad specificity phosphatase PhoE